MTSLRVIHESWGEGEILPSTELFDDEGNVYVDIMFEHGIEHEVLVDEGLGDVIRGAAYRTGQAVALPGRAARAVTSAVGKAKTAVTGAVNRAKTATKQFGKSVGAAYHVGRVGGIRTTDSASAPAPTPAAKKAPAATSSSDPNRLVTSKRKIKPATGRVSNQTQRGGPAATPASASEPETKAPAAPAGKKPVAKATNLSRVLGTKSAPRASVNPAPSGGSAPSGKKKSVSFSTPTKPTPKPSKLDDFLNSSYEYDDEDGYIEEGYVYNGESLYEAAAMVVSEVTVGPTRKAKGSQSRMKTELPRGVLGRAADRPHGQPTARGNRPVGRPTVADEDTPGKHAVAQLRQISYQNVAVPKNFQKSNGDYVDVSQSDAKRLLKKHASLSPAEANLFAHEVHDDPHNKKHLGEEVVQPRMSAYSADSRSFALEHTIRSVISEGRNLRKEANLAKYGLLEKAESLGERVNIARIVSRHAGPGGHSAEVHYSPEEDHYEVLHKQNGRVDRSKTTTHDSKSAAQRSAEQAMNSIKEDYELVESKRLLGTHTQESPGGNFHTAKVYKDNEWGEHVVRFFTDGKEHKDASYHTDDVEDAHDTAKAELKRMAKR